MGRYNERGDAADLLQLASRRTGGTGAVPDASSAGLEVAAAAGSMSCDAHGSLPVARGRGSRGAYYLSQKSGRAMLVVSRRTGERIRFKGPVEVILLATDAGQVRLGIRCATAAVDSE